MINEWSLTDTFIDSILCYSMIDKCLNSWWEGFEYLSLWEKTDNYEKDTIDNRIIGAYSR